MGTQIHPLQDSLHQNSKKIYTITQMDKAKAAVGSFLHKDGKHDTTVHETVNPAVTQENVTRTQHENVTLLLEYCNQNTSDELKSKLLLHTLSSTTIHDIESLPSASSASTAANLEQLRDIFLSGSAADLSSFLSSNQASLPPSFAPETLEEKLQYIILADYCSKKVGQTISYDEVASVLGLEGKGDEEDRAMEVEGWVIATIRAKLLTARLHQPSSSVSIMRATPRRFGAEQWQILQQRLESWKSSISNILEVVGRAVGPAPQRHQAQQQQQQQQQHDATALVQAADNVSNEQQQQVEVA